MTINNYIRKFLMIFVMALTGFLLEGMDPPGLIFAKTNDEKMVAIEEWMVPEMKTLLVLLEHQRGKNSSSNPIDAFMINENELILLTDALNALKKNVFEEFLENLAHKEDISLNIREIGRGGIRKLINAAQTMQAMNLNTVINVYFLSPDFQRDIKKRIVKNITPLLRQEMIKKSLRVFPSKNARGITFCCDNKNIIMLTGSNLWKTYKVDDFDSTQDIAGYIPRTRNYVELLSYNQQKDKALVKFDSSQGNVKKISLVNFKFSKRNNLNDAFESDFDLDPAISSTFASFNEQGDRVVICRKSGTNNLFVCDANTGQVIHNLQGHTDPVTDAHFNKQGDKIISCSQGIRNNFILWDAITGKKLFTLDGQDVVFHIKFSLDGNLIMSFGTDQNMKLWDVITGKELYTKHFIDSISSCYFNHKGSKVYVELPNHSAIVFDISNTQAIKEESIPSADYYAFDLKNDSILSVYRDQRLCKILDVSNINSIKTTVFSPLSAIDKGYFSPSGNQLVLRSEKNKQWIILDRNNLEDPILALDKHAEWGNPIWSADSLWIYLPGWGAKDTIVKIDFSEEDKKNIAKIVQLSLEQVRLINQMAVAKSRGEKELSFTNNDLKLYYALPAEIKEFLPQTLCPRPPMEKELKGELKMGNECAIF